MIDTIPQEVLEDFHNRTVVSVENLRWNDAGHALLTADVLFRELEPLGALPFTTHDGADTAHGRLVWENALAGTYGPIAEFTPPTSEELRANFPALSPRQLRLGLLSIGITEGDVEGLLAGDPAGLVEWQYATQYNRTHPLIDALGVQLQITPEQIDALWTWASEL